MAARLAKMVAATLAEVLGTSSWRRGTGIYSVSGGPWNRRWFVDFTDEEATVGASFTRKNKRVRIALCDPEFEAKVRAALAPLGCRLPKNWMTLERRDGG